MRRTHTNLDSTDTDDKSKSTKENPSEGDFPSAWEPSAAAAPAGDDLWTFPAENDNDYSNYNTEGGFAAAFEGVGFDVAVFEEDKVISFQDTGSSLFPGDLVVLGIWIPLAICTPTPCSNLISQEVISQTVMRNLPAARKREQNWTRCALPCF